VDSGERDGSQRRRKAEAAMQLAWWCPPGAHFRRMRWWHSSQTRPNSWRR